MIENIVCEISKKKESFLENIWLELGKIMVIVVILAIGIWIFVVEVCYIFFFFMELILQINDCLIIEKISY